MGGLGAFSALHGFTTYDNSALRRNVDSEHTRASDVASFRLGPYLRIEYKGSRAITR